MVNRNETIVNNIGLVHSIAKRYKNRGIEYDDLFQAGCVGLVKPADNFDESRGFAFSTYAVPVIMGEIKRLFRDGGAVKVSRQLKDKTYITEKAINKFREDNMREPTVSEIAEITGYEVEEVSEIIAATSPVKSLSTMLDTEDKEIDIPIDNSELIFSKLMIDEAVSKLDSTERFILNYRFFSGKTQSETATVLGLSQVQISRKEKRILSKLREYMK